MPYVAYTYTTDDDALAIKTYLFSLPAVHEQAPANTFAFPFDQRWAMVFWSALFNSDERFAPNTSIMGAEPGQNVANAAGGPAAAAEPLCWICKKNRADSGENKTKRSDLLAVLGKPTREDRSIITICTRRSDGAHSADGRRQC